MFVEDPSNGFEAAPQYFERNNVLVVNYALHADYQVLTMHFMQTTKPYTDYIYRRHIKLFNF